MDYIPRPRAARVAQELDELLEIHLERLLEGPHGVRFTFREALRDAYEAGVNSQRLVLLQPPPASEPPRW